MTIYLSRVIDTTTLQQAYEDSYHDYPAVQFKHLPELTATEQAHFLGLTAIIHTPDTHIGYQVVGEKTLLFVTIDNLMKGAASQAIENAELFL